MADAAATPPDDKPAQHASRAKTTLRFVAPHPADTFIVGDTVITTAGTPVASGDVDDILAAAQASGVTVEKVSN